MIVIFYGTGAELIKMLGVVHRVPRSEMLLVCTAQQRAGLRELHPQLNIEPDLYLSEGWKGKDVASMKQMMGLMLKAHGKFAAQFLSIKKKIKAHDKEHGTKSVAVVHGDTLTTVVGAYMGRFLGLPVAHLEAGLRSGDWRSPFPEELDRRIAAKIARLHFAPGKQPIANLKKERAKGEIIDTIFNTAKDSIEMAGEYASKRVEELKLPSHYGLVLLHRTELLENKDDLEAILKVISAHASPKTPIVFTEHTTTKAKIELYGLGHYLEKPGLIPIPKQRYFDFMAIVGNADYVVTDGGGLQEDSYFLGIPAIVHRKTTERHDGMGEVVWLSGMDAGKVEEFLKNHPDKKDFAKQRSGVSPSALVVDYFLDHKYISAKN